jgi:hypothetical protein
MGTECRMQNFKTLAQPLLGEFGIIIGTFFQMQDNLFFKYQIGDYYLTLRYFLRYLATISGFSNRRQR